MLLGEVVVNSPSRIQGLEESTIINENTNRTLRARYSSSNPSGSNNSNYRAVSIDLYPWKTLTVIEVYNQYSGADTQALVISLTKGLPTSRLTSTSMPLSMPIPAAYTLYLDNLFTNIPLANA